MNKIQKENLIKAAIEVKKYSYVPITNIGVGAAVLTKEGNIYAGCNMQSVISGLGTCAEYNAIANAISRGAYNYEAIAVVFPSKKLVLPCGACLQIIYEMSEVADYDIKIICLNKDNKILKETSIRKLIVNGYGPIESNKILKKLK
jgi:cytidine deaminase